MKIVIVLVVAVLLLATQPALRTEVGTRVTPAMTRMGLPLPAELLDPLLKWSVRGELRVIRRQLEAIERTGGRLPAPGDFTRYLQKNQTAGSGYDAWDRPYRLVVGEKGAAVVSGGPDRAYGTADDLREPLSNL